MCISNMITKLKNKKLQDHMLNSLLKVLKQMIYVTTQLSIRHAHVGDRVPTHPQ